MVCRVNKIKQELRRAHMRLGGDAGDQINKCGRRCFVCGATVEEMRLMTKAVLWWDGPASRAVWCGGAAGYSEM